MSDGPTISENEIENPIDIECPECGESGAVPEWWLGFETECRNCDHRWTPISGDKLTGGDDP